jgi:hypothetical protein
MRDGWLDEPLKSDLETSGLQRWREGRLEQRVLEQARCIFVTSEAWKTMLTERLPLLRDKTTVLTNCYPLEPFPVQTSTRDGHRLTFLYAGQFTRSKYNNRPRLLLAPLAEGLPDGQGRVEIVFQGFLSHDDINEINAWQDRFAAKGIDLIARPPVPRSELLQQIGSVDGLLLLSATRASILAKIFEYLPSRKPILAFCRKGSSVWQLAEDVPQMLAADLEDQAQAMRTAGEFFTVCKSGGGGSDVPEKFSEAHNAKIFLEKLLQ